MKAFVPGSFKVKTQPLHLWGAHECKGRYTCFVSQTTVQRFICEKHGYRFRIPIRTHLKNLILLPFKLNWNCGNIYFLLPLLPPSLPTLVTSFAYSLWRSTRPRESWTRYSACSRRRARVARPERQGNWGSEATWMAMAPYFRYTYRAFKMRSNSTTRMTDLPRFHTETWKKTRSRMREIVAFHNGTVHILFFQGSVRV